MPLEAGPLAPAGARWRQRRLCGALLVFALLAHCAAVGHAGTPNAWSTVALSGDVPLASLAVMIDKPLCVE